MEEGRRNTGMCQQLQLPGAEIVKALHVANAQMKPHSFLHLLVDSLKVHWGHKIKKKPSPSGPGEELQDRTVKRLAGSNCHRSWQTRDVWIEKALYILTWIFALCRLAACTCPLLHPLLCSLHIRSPFPPLPPTLLLPFPFTMEGHKFWIQISMLEKEERMSSHGQARHKAWHGEV